MSISPEIKKQFSSLVFKLSPENLSCDGELPLSVVSRNEERLLKAWADLEKQIGRTVTEAEAWAWVE